MRVIFWAFMHAQVQRDHLVDGLRYQFGLALREPCQRFARRPVHHQAPAPGIVTHFMHGRRGQAVIADDGEDCCLDEGRRSRRGVAVQLYDLIAVFEDFSDPSRTDQRADDLAGQDLVHVSISHSPG